MKKLFTIFFVSLLAVQVWSYDFESGGLYYNITSSQEPYTVEVTYQKYSFDNYSGLTIATIPEKVTYNGVEYSVTSIDDWTFYSCSKLTSVTIPNTVTSIGSNAFDGCYNLTYNEYGNAYYLGDSENSYLWLIKAKSTNITSCEINSNCKIICNSAFSKCVNLSSVNIPNSVITISRDAFWSCSNLTSITIPSSVKSIGIAAFENCNSLSSITIPNSVTSIGLYAFSGCNNLDYTAYDNAYYIGNEENPYLVLVEAKKKSIISCEINSQCKFIYENAFSDCNSLTSITIPNSVTSIGISAFGGCNSLQKVEFASIADLCNIKFEGCAANPLSYAHHLYINAKEVANIVIPSTVTNIGNYAFYDCSSLISVIISNSVTSIGDQAFYDCNSLALVTIPNSVKSIGVSAFCDCKSLTSAIIPNSAISIGDQAFCGCNSLALVTIPNSVKSIGKYAFWGCNSLTSVTIPESVTSIGENAFSNDLNQIICLGITPATLEVDPFPNNDTIYVPSQSVDIYKKTNVWKRKEIMPFYSIKFQSTNDLLGVVEGDSLLLDGKEATIVAHPTINYHFVKWSDGSTDNPRSYSFAKDTSFTAIFEAHTEVIDDAFSFDIKKE